ncbi:hypothetical protein SARC_06964 [Sphaeroforma arctica JP610]|uniref:Uncharacterized protein n=1 Tax=Sphaeroforma arctica JP610 TaxID=667725 RepID=A0A0L0FXK5_9EUKA|nr:hypothetical protein SARC_06964 [Sphaeroforma arctica JP610]KNC80688.1 hypothetical protein SARC_06964 [Sphaeroforma arctica JP610]|eukprot:XP_014154590.1 hypothetical protein SARC_06964 [Sphaeroforma arctica JP610]
MRTSSSSSVERVAIDMKKISCIDSHPSKALLVTSSLDRTARIWDLRQMKSKNGSVKPIAEQTCRLSVSSGYFSPSGAKVITTGMDDTIKVWDYTETPKTKPSTSEKATVVTKHYNQTGRWVTNFRAKFIGENHFHIGNMKRSVDIYAENGVLVRQLSDDEHMTAIPAVNDYHPGHGELAAGTHGKVHIYSNTDDSRQ